MNYYYTTAHCDFWDDIIEMIKENYEDEYEKNDVLVLGVHYFHNIDFIKNNNPNHNRIIIYQLEPLIKGHWWDVDDMVSRIKDADEVWDYDLDNIEILKKYGIDAKYRPFVYTESLKRIQNKEDPDIDVFFYGTLTPHRSKILEFLTNKGLEGKITVFSFGLFKDKLDEFISRSKIILDLQTLEDEENHIQKQSRIFYALINDKCIVSEKSKRNYFGDLITESNFDNLGKTLDYLLENDRWKDYSNVSEKFKEFKKNYNKEKKTMHNSAFRTAKLFFDNYCKSSQESISICEIGSQIYRSDICPNVLRDAAPKNSKYVGVDFCNGEGVDLILNDPYKFPFEDNTFDVIVTSSCFEHSEMFWLSFLECIRVLKPTGLLYCNAPSSNMPYHRFPVDCWRFFPDSGKALETWGKYSGYNLKLLESYIVKPNYQKNDDHMSDWVSIYVKDEKYGKLYPNRIMKLDNYDLNFSFTSTIWYH